MREHLEILIHHCRGRLEELDAERKALLEEVSEYEEMLNFELAMPQSERALKAMERRLGNLSPTWLAILSRLLTYKHFRAGDVVLVSNELHEQQDAIKKQKRGNVRFQLSAYAKKKLIERLGGGNYRISEKYRAVLELLVAERSRLASFRPPDSQTKFGPELAALAQERRVTPANPRPNRAQHERG
jgi:hypothetical protein